MNYRLLAGSCDGGPCPTFHIDDVAETVAVQGYDGISPVDLPLGERVVQIPLADWGRLLANLPLRMLLTALLGRLRTQQGSAAAPQYR